MKQTAVEWLMEIDKSRAITIEEWQQAKEMEKEQMRLVHKNGYDNSQYRHDCNYGGVEYWDSVPRPFEGYYNETFNTNG
jgi:hypothetical protein